jgi:hypothetical protein
MIPKAKSVTFGSLQQPITVNIGMVVKKMTSIKI